jgi:hypothetical protein
MSKGAGFLLAVVVATVPARALAATGEDSSLAEARDDFLRGADFIRKLQYADALAAFEHSAKLHPHAATTYNIAVCFRAMGRYTLAQKKLAEALAQDHASGGAELSETLKAETHGFLEQIDGLLAKAEVTLLPADAAIAVDGHPLEVQLPANGAPSPATPTLVAGTRPPGPGEAPPADKFSLVLDPGAHVLTLTRKGFADAVVNRIFPPGATTTLDLALDRLPATLSFASTSLAAAVTVNGIDVGLTPVDITRPAGQYEVAVKKTGFVTYETRVFAHAGERVDLLANLQPYKTPLTQRWWFWTAAGVLVSGVAVLTYAVTRPAPERPPLDGGGLGWTVQAH